MQQGDPANSYHQLYQSQFHNPTPYHNPNPNPIDPHITSWPSASASAPPVSSSDYPSYSPTYPPYPPSSDHLVSSTIPTAPAYSNSNPNPQFNAPSQYPYDQTQPSYYPNYDQTLPPTQSYSGPQYTSSAPYASFEDGVKYDRWGDYAEENSDRYEENSVYSTQDCSDDGVYQYNGGKVEPYGARGTAGSSRASSQVMFDDYGRPINLSNGNGNGSGIGNGDDQDGSKSNKVVKALPKADTEEDVKSGVQKFRVKILSEGYGQSDMDVLCQIGLDGIQMLDPATNRTLRIYPLETLTNWEVLDSYIFAFWAKMLVDIEPKRIRLKSNSYTANTILDTVTAASVQLKEIGERKDFNSFKASEQNGERKKGFDWINLIKPPNEEKDHWVPVEAVNKCTSCGINFNAFVRKHHCRNCGEIFCDKCTQGRTPLTMEEQAPVRVCDRCMAEVTQRLANASEGVNRSGPGLSHEDLAKKLKEELKRNSKASTGSKSEGSRMGMRDVACPTCTVHLQVQVPTSGSETIECSVCQHPFLVSSA